jgi:hypothetical protein
VPLARLVPSQSQPAAQSGIDLAQLHAAIREELAAAARSQPANDRQAPSAAKADAPASPELVAQRREAMQDIQTMIATAQWGEAERAEFHQKLSVLNPERARQALQQVTIGLNNGTIHRRTDMPPL